MNNWTLVPTPEVGQEGRGAGTKVQCSAVLHECSIRDDAFTGSVVSSKMNDVQDALRAAVPPHTAAGGILRCCACIATLSALPAQASLFQGDTLDAVADVIAWVALVIAPIVGITVFWLVHILPEKIAEKRHHPQAKAIQTMCLLSLFFGGLLWPIAWLWAYTKPVFHKMAYGTDVDEHGSRATGESETPVHDLASEHQRMRMKVIEQEEGLGRETTASRERA
jgi:hypothetical protein